MKKNIAILFPSSKSQGIFQHALSIADSLVNYSDKFNYYIFHYDSENPKKFLKIKNLEDIQFISLDSSLNSCTGKLKLLINVLLGKPLFSINKYNRDILKNIHADLLIIPFPLLFGFENKIPYIVFIPDIMHKYYPGFPEYPFLGRIKRDIVYRHSAKSSLLSAVDSQQGFEDLHKFYKIPKEKIRVIPYIPPGYIYKYKDMDKGLADNILKKYNLPRKFLFYPAQFWFHKNHLRLINAVKLVKENSGLDIFLVLVGSSKANYKNYQKVMSLIKEFKIENQIFHLGYVSDKEIVALYKKSLSLIFPTLIGPTSIPPLEAMVLETPVLCSNLFSMPEQIGDAGLLFNPFSMKDMAEKIHKIWTDEELRKGLVQKGRERVKNLNLENYAEQWEKVIELALKI